MMSIDRDHMNAVKSSIRQWLRADNIDLKRAIEKTVDEGLFSFQDVKHQILAIKQAFTADNIEKWAANSGFKPNTLKNQAILCLHAGNLPLVGLQDFIAVLISGASYAGKLSTKDPYLLPSLIKIVAENDTLQNARFNDDLLPLLDTNFDAWLFSGSKSNAEIVKDLLVKNQAISEDTPSLVRTAFFSLAYVDRQDKETMIDLTEAIFRYGGAGCRSVAMVISPYSLSEVKCELTDYVEQFWLKNPQHSHPPKSLEHRFALNKALGTDQAWLNDFLIEEGEIAPKEKFIVTWKKGGISTLSDIIKAQPVGLQSIYSTAEHIGEKIQNWTMEPLSVAQKPPVWWKPDGINTLSWFQKNLL
jgi:hypothetical protein